jgi:hypothetical protein
MRSRGWERRFDRIANCRPAFTRATASHAAQWAYQVKPTTHVIAIGAIEICDQLSSPHRGRQEAKRSSLRSLDRRSGCKLSKTQVKFG